MLMANLALIVKDGYIHFGKDPKQLSLPLSFALYYFQKHETWLCFGLIVNALVLWRRF